MVKKGRILFSFYFFFFFASSFAFEIEETLNNAALQQTIDFSNCILSPVPGKWANYQSLILNIPENYIALYSFTGDDPLKFGFAYDEAVLIEKDGDVDLRIAFVSDTGKAYEFQRLFQVVKASKNALSETEKAFLNQQKAFIHLDGISVLDIPKTFLYSLDDMDKPSSFGRKLSLGENDIKRYLPLLIEANTNIYRWMLYLDTVSLDAPSLAGLPSHNEQALTDKKNEVKKIRLSNPAFQIALHDSKDLDLKKELAISVLDGEFFSKNIKIDVYAENELQGSLEQAVTINKKIPQKPKINASSKLFYSRDSIDISVSGGNTFYYLIDQPEILSFDEKSLSYLYNEKKTPSISKVKQGAKTKQVRIHFPSEKDAVLYRFYVIAEDADGNLSDVESFSCIIDSYNYYINPKKQGENYLADGSPEFPFFTIQEALEKLKTKDSVTLHLLSNDVIQNPLVIRNTQNWIGHGNTLLQFNSEAVLTLEGATLSCRNLVFALDDKKKIQQTQSHLFQNNFFMLKNARILFENCDLHSAFQSQLTFLTAIDSRVDFFNSTFVLEAAPGSGFLSLVNSECNILFSHIALASSQGLMFSSIDGTVQLYESSFRGIGTKTKFADLINTDYFCVSNQFYTNRDTIQNPQLQELDVDKIPKELFFVDYQSQEKEFLNNSISKK